MQCRICGAVVSLGQMFCSHCGTALQTPTKRSAVSARRTSSRSNKLRLAAVIVVVLVIVRVAAMISDAHGASERKMREQAAKLQALAETEEQKKKEEAFNRMTPQQHLQAAQQLIKVGASWTSVEEGKKHLSAIDSKTQEAAEGRQLVKRYEIGKKRREEEEARQEAAEARKQAEADAPIQRAIRDAVAKTMENAMLDKGLNVDVTAIGKDHTILRIKWILASKALVHQFTHEPDFFDSCRRAGFRRVEITDGYDESWYWTLSES
jgi:hypothetical protein